MARTGTQMTPTRGFRGAITTDPFRELFDLQRDINRLFGGSFGKRSEEQTALSTWTPAADVYESGDAFLIRLELPEVARDNVKVNLNDGTLSITGERRLEFEESREGYHRVERSYGPFYRSFSLPPNVNAEAIAAEFRDGILRLTIPKKEEAKPKQIEVKVG